MSDNPKGYANPQLLVTAAELNARLPEILDTARATRPLLIDLRPAEQFATGHIPGAIHLDLFGLSLNDTDPAPLKAFLAMIEHLLAARGVAAERPVIVYDDRSGERAARAFWFLEFFGHPDVRVNLRNVPEELRPSQETPDPDDDPTREWRAFKRPKR